MIIKEELNSFKGSLNDSHYNFLIILPVVEKFERNGTIGLQLGCLQKMHVLLTINKNASSFNKQTKHSQIPKAKTIKD